MAQRAGENGDAILRTALEVGPEQLPAGLFAALLTSAPDAVVVIDATGTVLEFNPAAERTFGYEREQALGHELAELLVPPSLRASHRRALADFQGKREGSILDRRVELLAMRADGSEFPIELTVSQVSSDPVMFGAFMRDVSAQHRAVEAKDLLAAASAAFDASLDPVQTMRTIADSAVPQLADLCVIDLIRDDGSIGDSVVAAVDERVTARLQELRSREPLDITGTHPVARALRTGKLIVVHDLTDPAALEEVAQSEEHRRFMEEVGYRSAVVLQLVARGRLLGTLSFIRMNGGRRLEPDSLSVMEDLAGRAAMALDNANLYAERTRVARTLQRSLLPEALPAVRGVELASAYHPVGEGSEVGGDFYDVFTAPSGCWLVVGDVCGKGTEAAAVTALVRHSIRALALQLPSPAEVLRRANQVMLSHELFGRFATAIVVRIDLSQSPPRAVIASAGHPPPLIIDAAGTTRSPEVPGTLLGVLAELRSVDVEVELEPGASVVLYTDGLTDADAPRHELEPKDLCNHLSGRRHSSPAAVVELLEQLASSHGTPRLRDDIAILVAQLQR